MEHHLMRQLRLAFLGQKGSLEVCNRRIVPHLGAQPVHQFSRAHAVQHAPRGRKA